MSIILASTSPRRRELLALLGLPFDAQASEVDESVEPGEDPAAYVLRLSREKARAVAARLREESHGEAPAPATLVVAADTAVVDGPDALGKPAASDEAVEMLKRLRGRSHQVFTAITVLDLRDGEAHSDLCRTDVPMRAYGDDEIAAYVASGDPQDKAGAYAIQHNGFHPVDALAGCYANVMGLPLCHVTRTLRQWNIVPPADVPAACQSFIEYECPVHERILRGEL